MTGDGKIHPLYVRWSLPYTSRQDAKSVNTRIPWRFLGVVDIAMVDEDTFVAVRAAKSDENCRIREHP